ncbi:MAG TPA: hypothetical protein VFM14_00945 [Gemmatimonadales bacterium]|nr:hypothetical protein [Gemmatimonadales bacterium]
MAARIPGLIVLLLLTAARDSPAQSPKSSNLTRVVTGETLRKAGVIRLAEVLRLVDDWDAVTPDEFLWNATPVGESLAPGTRWTVVVDGQRMELDLFGTSSLARLPVPLEAIERVDVDRTTTLVGGELATAGVIHFHTRDPAPGFSAAGWATTGSEIGDPGPFAFTPLATPNVDRIGNDGAGRVSYRGRTWFVEGGLQLGKQNPTDPAILDRYAAASLGEDRVRSTTVAPLARVALRRPGSRHTLAIRYSRARDFFPLEPVVGELTVTERYAHIGADGTFGTEAGRRLRYYVAWAYNRAEERRAALPVAFDWKLVTLTAGAEAVTRVSGSSATVGLRARQVRASGPQPIAGDRLTIGSLYGALRLGSAKMGRPVVLGELSTSKGEVGVAASLRQRWRAGSRTAIELATTYASLVRGADNSIWAWTERGYPLLAEVGVPVVVEGPLARASRISLDAAVRVDPTAWSTIVLEALWRRHGGLTLVSRELAMDPADRSFGGPAFVTVDGTGQVAGGVAAVAAHTSGLAARVSYRYQTPVKGDDRFRAAQATVPEHVLRYTVEATPVAGLDLWSMLEYRSPTEWADFETVEAATGGLYRARVPASVGLDLAVQKWLWKRRLRAHLGFRNVFGSTLRYHPAGSTLGPRMYVQVEAAGP